MMLFLAGLLLQYLHPLAELLGGVGEAFDCDGGFIFLAVDVIDLGEHEAGDVVGLR